MIGLALLAGLSMLSDTVRVCVVDATTGQPLTGVGIVDSRGAEQFTRESCAYVERGPVQLRRIGYRPLRVAISEPSVVQMTPLLASAFQLDTQHVVAPAGAGAFERSRALFTIETDAARIRGATSMPQLLALLPFTQMRSARGETAVSLRSARREQVLVTLDGVPLNDPASGTADASELPLSLIGATSVAPGAAPVAGGPGAIGGVVALTSSTTPVATARVGSWESYVFEAAGRTIRTGRVWHGGIALQQAQNSFPFDNTAGASGANVREVRVNNDETRAHWFGSVRGTSAQLSVLGSMTERGMVGPMNVRAYDADRSHAMRWMGRAVAQLGATMLEASVRTMQLEYRDPRPDPDPHSRAAAATVNASRDIRGLSIAAGAGRDGVWVRDGTSLTRARAFGSAAHTRRWQDVDVHAGLRIDAVESHGVHPSFSAHLSRAVEVERGASVYRMQLRARGAQALRVPTLYDLYFTSPQRLQVTPLQPERVTHDAELESTVSWARGGFGLVGSASLVSRNVRNAIVWFPGNFSWSAANVGNEVLRGAEAQLRVTAPRATASVWTSWYDAMLHAGTLRIPTPYVAREAAGASASVAALGLTTSVNARAMGRRPFTQGPRHPAFELPAVLLLDAAVSRHMRRDNLSLLAALAVDNVTNVSWQSVRGFPAPGRSWMFSLTLTPTSR